MAIDYSRYFDDGLNVSPEDRFNHRDRGIPHPELERAERIKEISVRTACSVCEKLGIPFDEARIRELIDSDGSETVPDGDDSGRSLPGNVDLDDLYAEDERDDDDEPANEISIEDEDFARHLLATQGDYWEVVEGDDALPADELDDDGCRLDGFESLGGMTFRSFSCRASSINATTRTVDTVVTTETPVSVPDPVRMEMVPEVLLTSGAEWPASRQVPLLDSHKRQSVEDQIGSARELAARGDHTTATLHFSSTADDAWAKVEEGHTTDVSAGYQVLKRVYVPRGETKSIGGKSFSGPVNVVSKWRLKEVSLTPIGADEQAKLRGLDCGAAA